MGLSGIRYRHSIMAFLITKRNNVLCLPGNLFRIKTQLKAMPCPHKIIHTTSLHFVIQKVSALGNYYPVLPGIFGQFVLNGHAWYAYLLVQQEGKKGEMEN